MQLYGAVVSRGHGSAMFPDALQRRSFTLLLCRIVLDNNIFLNANNVLLLTDAPRSCLATLAATHAAAAACARNSR